MTTSTHVIVCAYGPVDRTERAIRQARSLSGGRRVRVVAADALVADELRDARLRADLAVLRGTHGVLEHLDALPTDATILLLHDDVQLTERSLAALRTAHESTGKLSVPFTNDEGTDHGIGALALDAPTRYLDEQRSRTRPTAPAHEVRPVCILGSSAQIKGLLPFDVIAAGTSLTAIADDIVAAEGAVASHANSCLERTVDADDRPILVATMIVRDEEEMLPDCLASLDGVVDRIVVCDTGSTDRTVEIAKAAGAEVIHREWRDDFGWARNEALEPCRDARYVIQIDADERLACSDPDALRRTLAAAHGEFHAFQIWMDSHDDEDASKHTRWRFPRIFDPNEAHFVGRLHEMPKARVGGRDLREANLDGVELHHLGYTPEVFAARDKVARNVAIAEAAFTDDANQHNALHFARSLEMVPERHEEAIAILDEWMPHFEEHLTPATVAHAKTTYARMLDRVGRTEDGLAQALDAQDRVPSDAAAALVVAQLATALERPQTVVDAAERSRERSLSPLLRRDAVDAALRGFEASALVDLGKPDSAFDVAQSVVDHVPDALVRWEPFVAAVAADASLLPRLVALASRDTSGGAVRAAIEGFRPDDTARFCLRSAEAGCADAELIRVGTVAAMVAGAWDLFDAFAPFLSRLAPQVRNDIADRLRARGEAIRAAVLAA